jgi:outer membrane protein assembly factor BamE (lipoprotein component of BamABCDE complex)
MERFLAPVQAGMNKEQVRALIGAPRIVSTNAAGFEMWDYSRVWSSEARVHFQTNNRVDYLETD